MSRYVEINIMEDWWQWGTWWTSTELWVPSQELYKPCSKCPIVMPVLQPEIKGHPQLHSKLKPSLGYKRPCWKGEKEKKYKKYKQTARFSHLKGVLASTKNLPKRDEKYLRNVSGSQHEAVGFLPKKYNLNPTRETLIGRSQTEAKLYNITRYNIYATLF